jgi:hypothetical protein
MIQTILQTVVTTVGIATMSSSMPATEFPQTPIQVNSERVHVVSEGESLSKIATDTYKNKDAWVTILKDNPQVKNPDVLEKGTILKMRFASPSAQQIEEDKPVQAMHDSIVVESSAVPVKSATEVYTGGSLTEAQITYLGTCEAGMDPAKNTGNGYYGAFQFSYGTWKSMETGYERADMAPIEVQKAAVQKLLSRSSIFHQFPGCAKKMRALGII